jgi:hypothetical protein
VAVLAPRGRDSPGPVVPVSACVSALLSQPPFARSPLPPKLLVVWASLAAAASPNARRGAAGCAVTSCDSHCPLLSRACCAGLLAACWCCLSLSPRAVWCGRPSPPPPPPASPAPSPRPPLPPLLLLLKRRLRPLPSPADPRKPPAACERVSCCTPPLAVPSAWFSLTTHFQTSSGLLVAACLRLAVSPAQLRPHRPTRPPPGEAIAVGLDLAVLLFPLPLPSSSLAVPLPAPVTASEAPPSHCRCAAPQTSA